MLWKRKPPLTAKDIKISKKYYLLEYRSATVEYFIAKDSGESAM